MNNIPQMIKKLGQCAGFGLSIKSIARGLLWRKLRDAGYEIMLLIADLGVVTILISMRRMRNREQLLGDLAKNPNSITVVVGCYSQISANEVAWLT